MSIKSTSSFVKECLRFQKVLPLHHLCLFYSLMLPLRITVVTISFTYLYEKAPLVTAKKMQEFKKILKCLEMLEKT